jgi:SAM-dependent methyltransferase
VSSRQSHDVNRRRDVNQADTFDRPAGRQQRLVFGEVAETYHQSRPEYPDEVIDQILGYCGDPPRRALEVGSGTGKATAKFAARGIPLVCLEPSPEMAAVARRNLAGYPEVEIVEAGFEDWPASSFELLFSAQAWHWIDRAIRYPKAHQVLSPAGALALFWNRPVRDPHDELVNQLDQLYLRRVPALHGKRPIVLGYGPQAGGTEIDEVAGSGLFTDISVVTHPWELAYSTQHYLDLMVTQSDHRMLGPDELHGLLDEVRELIDGFGSRLTVHYVTELFLARAAGPAGSYDPYERDNQ